MNYTITYHNDFTSPYMYNKPETTCQQINNDVYKTDQSELAEKILADILDAPTAELTLEQIKDDFSSPRYPITEEKAVQIQNYYNGRLALSQTILQDLKDHSPRTLHYDIPQKYNSFTVEDEDELTQNEAYIEIVIENAE